MCHTNPDLFHNDGVFSIYYWARTKGLPGEVGAALPEEIIEDEIAYVRLWCELIAEHNTFIGVACYGQRYETLGVGWLNLWIHWYVVGQAVLAIEVSRPSRHEQAEAYLYLSEWLDGKVSAAEKRRLLQISDNTA